MPLGKQKNKTNSMQCTGHQRTVLLVTIQLEPFVTLIENYTKILIGQCLWQKPVNGKQFMNSKMWSISS